MSQAFGLRKSVTAREFSKAKSSINYEAISNKYEWVHAIAHMTVVSFGSLSVLLSGSALVTSLTGLSLVIGGTIAGISALFGLILSSSAELGQRLAKMKANSVCELMSKALKDGSISESSSGSISEFI